MAKKFVETSTFTEKAGAEKTVTKKSFDEVNQKAFDAVFNNTHSTKKFESVRDEIETQTLSSLKESVFFEEEQQKTSFDESNPFFGDKNALEKMTKHSFSEVVSKPAEPAPTLEIKEEIVIKPNKRTRVALKPQEKRKKLWFITGAVCIVLFFAIFCYNMISINSLAKKVVKMEHKISDQEKVLDGQNNKSAEDQIADLLNN